MYLSSLLPAQRMIYIRIYCFYIFVKYWWGRTSWHQLILLGGGGLNCYHKLQLDVDLKKNKSLHANKRQTRHFSAWAQKNIYKNSAVNSIVPSTNQILKRFPCKINEFGLIWTEVMSCGVLIKTVHFFRHEYNIWIKGNMNRSCKQQTANLQTLRRVY